MPGITEFENFFKESRLKSVILCAFFVYVALLVGLTQFNGAGLVDRDSYYHTRYANLLPGRGLSRDFRWTEFSVWRDSFADKEFLFHVLLAPLCASERAMVLGGKILVVLLLVAFFMNFYAVIRANGIRAPALWTFVLLSGGVHYLGRLHTVRPHLLAILLTVIGIHLVLNEKGRWLAVVGFLFSWSYAAPHLLVGLSIVHAVAVLLLERRVPWRVLAGSAAGVLLGMLVNPYFSNNLTLWYIQNVQVLAHAWGIGDMPGLVMGPEFDPVDTRRLLTSSRVISGALAGGVLVRAFSRMHPSAKTCSLFLMTVACFGLYSFSSKFIIYFAPVAVFMCASVVSDALAGRRLGEIFSAREIGIGVVVLGAVLLFCHYDSCVETADYVRNFPPPTLEGASAWLRANVPKGQTVLHLNWEDFNQLFHFDPDHRYINGLDPVFMYAYDKERCLYLEDVRNGHVAVRAEELHAMFGARYLVISKQRYYQYEMAVEAGLERLYEDRTSAVFRLVE